MKQFTFECSLTVGDNVKVINGENCNLSNGTYRVDCITSYTEDGETFNVSYMLESMHRYGKDWNIEEKDLVNEINAGNIVIQENPFESYAVSYIDTETNVVYDTIIRVEKGMDVSKKYFEMRAGEEFHFDFNGKFTRNEVIVISFEKITDLE